MTAFDYVCLTVVTLSVVFGFWRGVVSEVLAIVAWVLALVLGRMFAARLSPELSQWIYEPSLQYLAAFAGIGITVLLLAAVVRMLVSSVVKAVGLGFLDRFLGAIFGLARGIMVMLVLVAAGGLTAFPKQAWWRDATLVAPLETAVVAIKPWLPAVWASKIRYR